ncbi:hypothetical protein BTVI_158755 [Pitangus sulphuratus]|nr:hypothetical protein BTVI_158755 [Pitangus sulphuratus]
MVERIQTLEAMDSILTGIVWNTPPSKTVEEQQNILQVLLDFTRYERIEVQVAAMERICTLSEWMDSYSKQQPFERYLTCSERTRIILAAMEEMKKAVSTGHWNTRKPILWVATYILCLLLTDVPEIVSFMHKSLQSIKEGPKKHCFDSLLLLVAEFFRRK